jgi:6,7-dimethyl-8-ribityllumazine synthase
MAEPKRAASGPAQRAEGARFVIVEARFYDAIGDHLLNGAKAALEAAGAEFEVVAVPGALEIPAAVRMLTADGNFDGAIALGCVIRGETYHFEIVANESSRGLMNLSMEDYLPVGNGILTVENEEQAIVRADPKQGDKGGDAARAAIALYHIQQRMERE